MRIPVDCTLITYHRSNLLFLSKTDEKRREGFLAWMACYRLHRRKVCGITICCSLLCYAVYVMLKLLARCTRRYSDQSRRNDAQQPYGKRHQTIEKTLTCLMKHDIIA